MVTVASFLQSTLLNCFVLYFICMFSIVVAILLISIFPFSFLPPFGFFYIPLTSILNWLKRCVVCCFVLWGPFEGPLRLSAERQQLWTETGTMCVLPSAFTSCLALISSLNSLSVVYGPPLLAVLRPPITRQTPLSWQTVRMSAICSSRKDDFSSGPDMILSGWQMLF